MAKNNVYKLSILAVVAVIAVMSVVSLVRANSSLEDNITQVAGQRLGDRLADDILANVGSGGQLFGGTTHADWNVGGDLTVGGDTVTFSGSPTIVGTTTGSLLKYLPYRESVSFSGTSTAQGTTIIAVVREKNTTGKKICKPVILDVSTALGSIGSKFTVGTTTTAGDLSLTVTSTATLIGSTSVTTSTAGWSAGGMAYNLTNTAGSFWTTENTSIGGYWIWDLGQELVGAFDLGGATSSSSWASSGGFTGVATLSVDCWIK